MMIFMKKYWLALLMFWCSSSLSYGQCELTVSNTSASFGETSSFSFIGQAFESSVLNSGLDCRIPVLSLLIKNHVYATYTSMNQIKLVNSASTSADEKISYELFYDPERTKPVEFGVKNDLSELKILDLLGLLGGNSKKPIPLYLRIPPQNLNLTAGRYQDQITIAWEWDICPGLGALGICIGRDRGNGQTIIHVNLDITKDCKISAGDINFGTAPVIAAFDEVSGTINIICTKGTLYTVGLSNGEHYATSRRMNSGAHYIAYEIYKGASPIMRWGKQGGERRSSNDAEENAGTGWGADKAQIFRYIAKIFTEQKNPPAGVYTDVILLDVEF